MQKKHTVKVSLSLPLSPLQQASRRSGLRVPTSPPPECRTCQSKPPEPKTLECRRMYSFCRQSPYLRRNPTRQLLINRSSCLTVIAMPMRSEYASHLLYTVQSRLFSHIRLCRAADYPVLGP